MAGTHDLKLRRLVRDSGVVEHRPKIVRRRDIPCARQTHPRRTDSAIVPAIVLKTAAETANNTRFRAVLVLTISRNDSVCPLAFSLSTASAMRLSSAATIGSRSSPLACVRARTRRASSSRPWCTSQRGDSGTKGRMAMHSTLKTPWTSDGVRHAHVPV